MKEKDKQLREKVETSIFIIGNGFDLTLGLKTKYIDFFENKISPFNVRSIKKYIKLCPELNLSELSLMKLYELDEKLLKKEREYNGFNQFGAYLYKKSKKLNKKDYSWTFVEEEIINYIVDGIRVYTGKITEDDLYYKVNLFKNIKNEEELYDFFIKDIGEFEFWFGMYIMDLKKPEDCISKIKTILKIDDESRKKINIINFNYTTYLNDILKDYIIKKGLKIEKLTEIEQFNIHGTYENPIFGFDLTELKNLDFEELDFNKLRNTLSQLTKTAKLARYKTISDNILPDNVQEINFYGHSLSKADYSYFQTIFDLYEIESSKIKLNFYYNENRKGSMERTQISVFELMEAYGKSFDNKDRGLNLAHKMQMQKRLNFCPLDI